MHSRLIVLAVLFPLLIIVGCGGSGAKQAPAAAGATGAPQATSTPATATPTGTQTPAPATPTSTPTTVQVVEKATFQQELGAPPPAGWLWVLAELKTQATPGSAGPHEHDLPWLWYVPAGTTELTVGTEKAVLAAGSGRWVALKAPHSHTYPANSRLLGVHLRPADMPPPPANLHDGTRLFVSAKPIDVPAGTRYTLRAREFTLPPGARLPESLSAGPNIGYVIEGTLALQAGDAVQRIEAGKAFEWPLTGRRSGSADGAQPVRLVLFDARP